ncbi:hypothetical protein [Paenibacillus taichungensis]|uniref:hypothetical protein n=1 Tax=Paenibacillus taichungensis TaxID=484184 RepID=UPI0038CF36CA
MTTYNDLLSVENKGEVTIENFNRSRVEYLLEWTTVIVPVLELLSGTAKLPKNQTDGSGFLEFIQRSLSEYCHLVKNLHPSVMNEDATKTISFLTDSIVSSVQSFLQGDPHESYSTLADCLKSIASMINNSSEAFTNNIRTLYKMRTGGNTSYSSDEMFHIPFEKRGLVKTNRYSIPGFPCVYLGSSPLICWEELGRPDLNTVQTSLFVTKENVNYIDLSTNPAFVYDHIKNFYIKNFGNQSGTDSYHLTINEYLKIWHLIFSCSIRVKHVNDTFKPEYIFPQMLLQWVSKNNYDGIAYFSTKIDNYSLMNNWIYKNYAFPVKSSEAAGTGTILRSKFEMISAGVPWQIYRFYRDNKPEFTVPYDGGMETNLNLYSEVPSRYAETDFGRLQEFFNRIFHGNSVCFREE